MQIELAVSDISRVEADVLVLPVAEGGLAKQRSFATLDQVLGGAVGRLAAAQDFQGKAEQTLELVTLGRLKARAWCWWGSVTAEGWARVS